MASVRFAHYPCEPYLHCVPVPLWSFEWSPPVFSTTLEAVAFEYGVVART